MSTQASPVIRAKRRIQASKGFTNFGLGDFWAYRELLYFMTLRDIQVRYKQTVLGAAWAILQPFLTMVVFSFFFGNLAQIPSDNIPYPIFSYAALIPWTFFSSTLAIGSNSIIQNTKLITKVYFPRAIIPISRVLAGLVDFFLAFSVLLAMMVYFGIVPTVQVVFLPIFLLVAIMTSLAVSLWLSAMNVQFRDIRYIIPFLTQSWLFITPVVYPTSMIEDPVIRFVYSLNPMVGVIEGFRWAILGTDTAPGLSTIISVSVSAFLLITGLYYFRRMEKTFADII